MLKSWTSQGHTISLEKPVSFLKGIQKAFNLPVGEAA